MASEMGDSNITWVAEDRAHGTVKRDSGSELFEEFLLGSML